MAFTPCASHGARYKGGANTFFLRLVRGGDSHGGKLQVCPACADQWSEYLHQHMILVSEGNVFSEYSEPLACANDGGELGQGPWTFYGNAYVRGHEETQWYGKVCHQCFDAVYDDLSLGKAGVSLP